VLLLLYSQYLANPHVFQECFSELPREKARGKTRFIGFIGFVELIELLEFRKTSNSPAGFVRHFAVPGKSRSRGRVTRVHRGG